MCLVLFLNTTNLTINQLPELSFQEESIKDFIANWTIKFNVPHNVVNSLLKGLKTHICFKDFPIDSRTLMSTPKQTSLQISRVDPGTYYHFSLTAGIKRYIPNDMINVKLH